MGRSSFSGSRNTTMSLRERPVHTGQRWTTSGSPGFNVANMLVLSTTTKRITNRCSTNNRSRATTKALTQSSRQSRTIHRTGHTSPSDPLRVRRSLSIGRLRTKGHFTTVNSRFQRMPVCGSLVNHTNTALPTT